MVWFWQRKKVESEKKTAEQQAANQKKGLLARISGRSDRAAPIGKVVTPRKASATGKAAKRAAAKPGSGFGVLLGPIVTEKAARLAESGTYIFAVAPTANKITIAESVRQVYDVHPIKVAVVNTRGKPKVFAQRYGRRASTRKAYVTLKAGETIELFEGTEKK